MNGSGERERVRVTLVWTDEPGSTLQKLDPADVITLEEAKASWAALQ